MHSLGFHLLLTESILWQLIDWGSGIL